MNWNSARPWASTVVRLVLGAVWLWAGLSKLHTPRSFVQTVRAYDATPEWLSRGIGYGLPILEVCLGVLLILGAAVRLAAAMSGVLFVVFLVGVAQAGARGIKLQCGCFGGGGQTAGTTTYTLDILRDIGLLLLAAYLVWWHVTRVGIESFLSRNDYVAPPSAKQLRKEGGQRKYNAAVEAKQRVARERARYLNASLAIVVILVSLIGIGVQAGRAKVTVVSSATNASVTNGVVYGKAAAATVDIYEDFQCPHCLQFEQQVATQLDKDVVANLAQVRFHTLSFLDADSSGNDYST
ncbi:MAG: thioredoxin domain-containing protein, partial [Actinomycetota bacterium]|nr:thioredoxin domain-containing protein [Actinomycetota bacterium]